MVRLAFLASLISALAAAPAWAKLTVCTATLNSDDEKKVFQKKLNPSEFEFVELVPTTEPDSAERATQWFHDACRKKIRCDVLLISGHFNGSFFGASRHRLPLDVLERRACTRSCPGLLESPREVFLMGCNTLASKENDHRSPDDYTRVLVEDGFDRAEAERMSEFRYGPLGQTNKARMQRIFERVPHLYGFHSVGPLGKVAKNFLEKYFNEKKNYSEHLEREAVTELASAIQALNDSNRPQPNRELAQAFRTQSFAQCSGLNFAGDTEADEIKRNICRILDDRASLSDRIAMIETVLSQSNYVAYLPTVQSFFKANAKDLDWRSRQTLRRLTHNEKTRTQVMGLAPLFKTTQSRLDLAELARTLEWIDDRELAATKRSVALALLTPKMSRDSYNQFCNIGYGTEVTAKDVKPTLLTDPMVLAALSCVKSKDPELLKGVLTQAKNPKTELRTPAIKALHEWEAQKNPDVRAAIQEFLWNPKNEVSVKQELIRLFGATKSNAPCVDTARTVLDIVIRHPSPQMRTAAAVTLQCVPPSDQESQAALLGILREGKDLATLPEIAQIISHVWPAEQARVEEAGLALFGRDNQTALKVLQPIGRPSASTIQKIEELMIQLLSQKREYSSEVFTLLNRQQSKNLPFLRTVAQSLTAYPRKAEELTNLLRNSHTSDVQIHRILAEAALASKRLDPQARLAVLNALANLIPDDPETVRKILPLAHDPQRQIAWTARDFLSKAILRVPSMRGEIHRGLASKP